MHNGLTREELTDKPAFTRSLRFGNLTYEEIAERAGDGTIAVVPIGCTEQQGPHLPVDFDTWFAERLMLAAAEKARDEHGVNALVLPALPFGPTPEHRNYGAGYVDVPSDVHQQTVRAILSSLAQQGFQRITLWQGCGGHHLSEVVTDFNAPGRATVSLPSQPFHAIWCRLADPEIPGGHADSFTTSICLYLRPDDVRIDRIVYRDHQPVDWDDPALDFARYSSTGIIGDPTHASAGLGRRLWEDSVEAAASALLAIARSN